MEGYKTNKPLLAADIWEDIMFLADTYCPQNFSCFASRPTVHFSDNLSAAEIISSHIPAARRGLFTN